jgi:2,3-bisphosphoglycerate-independent phosphoglycerate mutase
MKAIMIIGDGMADRPLKELSYLTPLEVANIKNMNWVASKGVSGLLDPISPGIPAGSDLANLAILGYNPYKIYAGRGAFEAEGSGIKLREEDIAFRCDFATIDENFYVIDERAGRIRDGLADLGRELQGLRLKNAPDIEIFYKNTLGFKGILILRGGGLSANVASRAPRRGCRVDLFKPLDRSTEAKTTCEVLREFVEESHLLLKDHPVNQRRRSEGKPEANVVVPWGGGKKPLLRSFQEKYKRKAACVAAVSLIKGIARLAGITVVDVPGATGEVDTDTLAKADVALRTLKDHDLIIVHVAGPDEASHDGDVAGKISIIQKIDSMVGAILERSTLEETCIVLLADHTTSTKLRKHTGDPTPITIASTEVIRDSVLRYNERAVYGGGLGRIQGRHVMSILLNLMDNREG